MIFDGLLRQLLGKEVNCRPTCGKTPNNTKSLRRWLLKMPFRPQMWVPGWLRCQKSSKNLLYL